MPNKYDSSARNDNKWPFLHFSSPTMTQQSIWPVYHEMYQKGLRKGTLKYHWRELAGSDFSLLFCPYVYQKAVHQLLIYLMCKWLQFYDCHKNVVTLKTSCCMTLFILDTTETRTEQWLKKNSISHTGSAPAIWRNENSSEQDPRTDIIISLHFYPAVLLGKSSGWCNGPISLAPSNLHNNCVRYVQLKYSNWSKVIQWTSFQSLHHSAMSIVKVCVNPYRFPKGCFKNLLCRFIVCKYCSKQLLSVTLSLKGYCHTDKILHVAFVADSRAETCALAMQCPYEWELLHIYLHVFLSTCLLCIGPGGMGTVTGLVTPYSLFFF